MEPSFIIKYSVWLLTVSVLLQAYTSRCCLENEKLALFQLKSYIMSFSTSARFTKYLSNELSSWDINFEGNCCQWNRVTCNRYMQHVTKLSLYGLIDREMLILDNGSYIEKNIVLNVSLFQPFGELISLDLSSNGIHRLEGSGGYKTLGLRKLEILDFGDNALQLQELLDLAGSLTSLRKLFLNDNQLVGNFPGQELANLKKLQVLDLRLNRLHGSLSDQGLAHLKNLQVLNLSENVLNGSLPSQGLCKLRYLEELILDWNEFSGSIPKCLWNLTSLRVVDLSYNSFSGNLPSLINLPSLQWLIIHNNYFQGRVALCYLMNHSRLEGLFLSNNALQVEVEDSSCSSTFKLVGLGLSQCNLSGQSDPLMKFLSYQSNLQYVDLSCNGLVGLFPEWLLQNDSNIKYLNLRNNSMGGSLKLPKHSNLSLSYSDVSSNKLNGRIPDHVGMVLSSVQILNMSLNSFDGNIPTTIGNMTLLYLLDLSNNIISGEVPRQLFSDCTFLEYLLLSNNNLQGDFFPEYMNLTSLSLLMLEGNDFGQIGGRIKGSLNISTMLGNLNYLDISNNRVTGELPSWIGNLTRLSLMSLAENEFHGEIPSQLCNLKSLNFLDLSKNRFTGEIPSCVGHLSLNFLHMHGNYLTGAIPEGLAGCSDLLTLDLENNKLSGGIPRWIDRLSNLVILLLGGNQLEGELPVQLCGFQRINIVDLSDNSISGVIPSCFQNLPFGAIEYGTLTSDSVEQGIPAPWEDYTSSLIYEIFVTAIQEEVQFIVKSRYIPYKGNILTIMSGLDLSRNRLIGDIPHELGELRKIQTMNLSHNRLSGSIPRSFSKLKNIESLDLSSNNLSGTIPSELVSLTFIEIFNVSCNNLSGQVPETAQFGSFDESSYRANPLLCGSLLPRSCGINESVLTGNTSTDEGFDMETFLWSFGMSYVTVLLAFIAVLAINPYWRRAWFAFIHV